MLTSKIPTMNVKKSQNKSKEKQNPVKQSFWKFMFWKKVRKSWVSWNLFPVLLGSVFLVFGIVQWNVYMFVIYVLLLYTHFGLIYNIRYSFE